MICPPSIPEDVKARAFCALDGELAIAPCDAQAFLEACRRDQVRVLGWEVWVTDHIWAKGSNDLVHAAGYWCGGVPVRHKPEPAVLGGDGDVDETERQLGSLDLSAIIEPKWMDHIRLNFTLDAE